MTASPSSPLLERDCAVAACRCGEAVALGAAVQSAILAGQVDLEVQNPFFHQRTLSKLGENFGI